MRKGGNINKLWELSWFGVNAANAAALFVVVQEGRLRSRG